jgi:hypothetical protein
MTLILNLFFRDLSFFFSFKLSLRGLGIVVGFFPCIFCCFDFELSGFEGKTCMFVFVNVSDYGCV